MVWMVPFPRSKRARSPTSTAIRKTTEALKKKTKIDGKSQPLVSEAYVPLSKSEIFPFLQLPAEIRNKIYELTLNWNGIHNAIKSLEARYDDDNDELAPLLTAGRSKLHRQVLLHFMKRRQTPVILRLNIQITQESLAILHAIPLVFEFRVTRNAFEGIGWFSQGLGSIGYPFMGSCTIRQLREVHFTVPTPLHELEAATQLVADYNRYWIQLFRICGNWTGDNKSMTSNLKKLVIRIGKTKWVIPARRKSVFEAIIQTESISEAKLGGVMAFHIRLRAVLETAARDGHIDRVEDV
ncbi:hypothetical protein EJ08DRAFT_702982 [Tothia fuscella]|uniref:Uncharacterized protein n=1 Tax=Tothia fuscella TaxID=1048955 RepID=A0A9P4NF90_9PEZI|nr:hypothetical protein EJ08DRAFT_702982 [Tothia fuscella]